MPRRAAGPQTPRQTLRPTPRQTPLPVPLPAGRPNTESAHLLHAEAMERRGDLAGAVAQYQQALQVNSRSFAAWNNLGNLFASLKDWPTARTFLEQAEALHPLSASVKNNLANVLGQCGLPELSVGKYRAAIEFDPENPQFRSNLGIALQRLKDWTGAEEMLVSALALRPGYPTAYANLAYLFYEQGRLREAEDLYRKAIQIDPDCALAHHCLGQLLLYQGRFEEGWRELEWRWRWDEFPSPRRHFQVPQWKGEALEGRRILLHAEQGLGDTIQFVRYVPMVAALGAYVTLEVHPELMGLMRSVAGVSRLVARGKALPPFELHCPLMSLPLAFGTNLETVPGTVPYLRGEGPVPPWAAGPSGASLRVGVVWAGNPGNGVDSRRSLAIEEFRPLFGIPGVAVYSFQRGRSGEVERSALPFQGSLPESDDFAATAAALREMDLIVSADTAVAHLAGALGLPVWILLPFVSDWRWLRDAPESPWYPTARLFRQGEDRQWWPVVDEVSKALVARAKTTSNDATV